jgi:two-component system, chemotaxis family, CheB/CheR fusion protein
LTDFSADSRLLLKRQDCRFGEAGSGADMRITPDETAGPWDLGGGAHEGPQTALATARSNTQCPIDPSTAQGRGDLINLLEEIIEIDLWGRHVEVVITPLQARIAMRRVRCIDDYLLLLADSAEERASLRDAILNGSTRFFRDEDVFAQLSAMIDAHLRVAPTGAPVRLWVAGCSTGEEAYSLLIKLHEVLAIRGETRAIRMFATDLRGTALDHGRRGVYSTRACDSISPAHLARFFAPVAKGHQVQRRFRDEVMWTRHDVARDPPFPHIDLVSCRNLLVHFGRSSQEKILRRLHFALRPDGLLLLGSSESTCAAEHLFRPVSRMCRLYEKRGQQRERARQSGSPAAPCAGNGR